MIFEFKGRLSRAWMLGLIMGGLQSCTPVDCFHTSGEYAVSDRSISATVDSVIIHGEINLTLKQDYQNRLILKGGSNILPWIATTMKGRTLSIKDENECSFLRDLGFVADVELTLTDLQYIAILSSGTIRSDGTLRYDTLVFEYLDGAGNVALNVESNSFRYQVMNGASGTTLKGKANSFQLLADGFGPVDATSLEADYLFAYHKGSNLLGVKVAAGGTLQVEIHSNGNVGYIGNPGSVSVVQKGDGRLLKL